MARVQEETKGRIKQERENHDLRLEQVKVEASEQRETVMEAIKLAGTTVGAGVKEFLSDTEKMTALTATLTAVALGVYGAKVAPHFKHGSMPPERLNAECQTLECRMKEAVQRWNQDSSEGAFEVQKQ